MLAPGTTLQNRYTIITTLGQGGMGAVYLAEDRRLPGRHCAIKENLPDPNASPPALAQARQQFLAEASILARLDHPNLPKVSDYFTEAGREYLVMDYVEGEDLESALQRTGKPLPEKPVLIWTEQVLDALEYLHSQRPQPVIHRDIKPANLRLMPQGKVKLVDFGLVKLLDPNDPQTKTALKGLGTPEYAPLEQYAGAGHTDARSDLYSLGATLYHLLTNVAPPDVHQRMLNPGVLAPPRQLNRQLSESTEQAVLRAMEIHPDQRYHTAREMRQALKGTAPPPPPPGPTPMPMPGTPGLLVMVVIGLVTLLYALFVGRGGGTPRGVIVVTPLAETPTPEPPTALQQLKDRFGMEFVYVPAGPFTMGSDSGHSDETPVHTVDLAEFWIGRTEVTNAQYRPFVEAGGYQQRELWTQAGWTWREANNVTQPGCWNDEQWNQPAYPVVCVSWYEAVAYTRWLAQETGLDVRLPTEAEWEKSARGTDGRRFPWGDDWDETKANTSEGGADRTTSVGDYPAGASPYGALDMAGNVWEWTSSLYKGYPYDPADGREDLGAEGVRVLRGGSWGSEFRWARCAARVRDNAYDGLANFGLRVVLSHLS
jgi:serine/threonine-protein kinase